MNKKQLLALLVTFLIFKSFALASEYQSSKADTLFKDIAISCKKGNAFYHASQYRKMFYDQLENDDYYSKDTEYWLRKNLENGKCDPLKIENYFKQINQDTLPFHANHLVKIKDELLKFQDKKLDINFFLTKYENYKKEYNISSVESDTQIAPLLQRAEDLAKTRQQTCTDVMNLKAPLELNKPKNQDSTGWCYSYTASDLVAHVLGKEPSAAYMALLTNDKALWKMFGVTKGGFIETPIEEMMNTGICLEKDLPSTDYAFSKEEEHYNLNGVYKKIFEIKKIISENNISNKEDVKNILCQNNLQTPLSEIFSNLNIDQIAKILIDSNSSFKELADKSCPLEKNHDLQKLKIKTVT